MLRSLISFILIFATPVLASDDKVAVRMHGIGRMTCAHWQSTQSRRYEGAVWIHGFWTALNYVAAASDQPQSKMESEAILAEVDKVCATDSHQILATATWMVFVEGMSR
jgi:hypothetical protein